jgi:hypothetical protein
MASCRKGRYASAAFMTASTLTLSPRNRAIFIREDHALSVPLAFSSLRASGAATTRCSSSATCAA